jgi:hypothetical protein
MNGEDMFNATYSILLNMMEKGLIKDDLEMAEFITNDNQYKFVLRREPVQLWVTQTSEKFKCFIDIYDNITDNKYLTLNCSESDIINILDCYVEGNDYLLQNITVPALKPFSSNGNFFIIEMEFYRVDVSRDVIEDISKRWLIIKEYNPSQQLLINRIIIEMDVFEIEELMDLLHFIFLIDLDPGINKPPAVI